MINDEIVSGERSGGATTSHTIVIRALQQLLAVMGPSVDAALIERAVIEDNILGKDTVG
jgi:hypothetical protein